MLNKRQKLWTALIILSLSILVISVFVLIFSYDKNETQTTKPALNLITWTFAWTSNAFDKLGNNFPSKINTTTPILLDLTTTLMSTTTAQRTTYEPCLQYEYPDNSFMGV